MKLHDYPIDEIRSAIAKKGLTLELIGKRIKRAPSTVGKAINGTSQIPSEKLNSDIVKVLQPELDMIHEAFLPGEPCMMIGSEVSQESLARVSAVG